MVVNNTAQPERQGLRINSDLAQLIQKELGQNVYLCYQCVKCTSGCPVGKYFDWQPNQIMRAVQLGQEDIALKAQTPWLCASCQACTTRCPQDLDIAAIMDFLTREALDRGIDPPIQEVDNMNKAFLREVRLWGRSYELGLMAELKLRNFRTHPLTEDLDMGIKMIARNKFPFFPTFVRPPRNVKPVPGASNAIAYYPGCSLHATSPEFNTSTKAIAKALDLELIEPEGWLCCGSSSAHRADPEAAMRLPMENLSLIEQSGFSEVTMPCAACFNRHKAAQYEMRHDEGHKSAIDESIGYSFQDSVKVNSLGETIIQHVGPEEVSARVKQPLQGLRVVCYYGCLLTRPPQITEAAHPENPTELDDLVAALGAEVLDWSYKTTCCGAAHSLTRQEIVFDLSSTLIKEARLAGAEAIVVACPLCHTNLDARQFQMDLDEELPVIYFTQLMALALGLPQRDTALNKNLVDPRPLLKEKGFLS
jgi:heterodisulfide reductase subunit B